MLRQREMERGMGIEKESTHHFPLNIAVHLRTKSAFPLGREIEKEGGEMEVRMTGTNERMRVGEVDAEREDPKAPTHDTDHPVSAIPTSTNSPPQLNSGSVEVKQVARRPLDPPLPPLYIHSSPHPRDGGVVG